MISRLWRWFRKAFKLDRRWMVRFHGGHERSGFRTDKHAHGWAREKGFTEREYVVCHYDPIDLRLPGISHSQRNEYHP